MAEAPSPRSGRALLALGFVAAAVLLAWTVGGGSGAAWLGAAGGDDGKWIVYPHVPRTTSHPVRPLMAVFRRDFEIAREGTVRVSLRCLGECDVEVDGRSLGESASRLTAGLHQVVVRVRRSDGPPALAFELRSDRERLVVSDESWLVSLSGAVELPARLASETVRPPAPALPDVPWPSVLVLALLAVALSVGLERTGAGGRRALPALVVVAWLALLAHSRGIEPDFVGFDVEHHLFYLRFLLERGAIPSPTDGIQTYQPPLFYLLSAGWLRLLGLAPQGEAAALWLRSLTFALGLVHVFVSVACVRLLLPGRGAAAALALVFAAAMPVHLTLVHAFSNEVLAAALSTVSMWTLLRALGREELRAIDGLAVGTAVGLALLAKLSALVLVPVAIGALLVHRPRSAAAPASALAIVVVAGWYYARIAGEFGTPFVGNWDALVGFEWWQDPGLRELGSYLRFGGSLGDPWFAGFDSVWDGVYSTLFADGLASGASTRLLGPAWNHGLARVAVVLGLVPLGLAVLGAALGGARIWRRPDAKGLAVAGLSVALGAAFVFMTLRVPSYAQAKAVYLSPALIVLVVAFALGIDRLRDRSGPIGRTAVALCWLWAVTSFAVFWIDADAPDTLRSRGEKALAARAPDRALAYYERARELRSDIESPESAVSAESEPVWAIVGSCRARAMKSQLARARRDCERALRIEPEDPDALYHAAAIARRLKDPERALVLLEKLRVLAPQDVRAPAAIALLAERIGDPHAASQAAAQWLRFDPANPEAIRIEQASQ